jgi:GDP-D-mannose dehydratase
VFPLTNSITDKKTVVDREKYERVKESMINYRKQVEVLEGQTIELSNLKKGLEKSLSDNIENLESHSHEVVIENLTKLIEVYDYLKTKNLLEAVRQPILQGKIDSLDFGTRNILFSIGLLINEQGFKNQSISPFTPFGQLFRIFIQELENTRKFENK